MTEEDLIALEEIAAEEWAAEMEQLRWAEAGGYAAGIPRPVSTTERRPLFGEPDDGSNDIPF